MTHRASLALLALCALALPSLSVGDEAAAREPAAGDPAPPTLGELRALELFDLEGRACALGEQLGEGPLVLCYTGVGCPISQKYAGRLSRLAASPGASKARFLAINANPQDDLGAIAKEREQVGLELPVLKDASQRLTRRLGATTTTEVFVFDAAGALRYRGAVDDQYSLGAARPAPTQDFLADALAALAAGAEPPVERTPAPGCKLTLLAEEELAEPVTWSGSVAAIVQRNCEVCHRPGQAGPFSLQSYEKARGWGEMIAEVVKDGRMPPWHASQEYDGRFQNERRLAPREREALLTWVETGMARGNPDEDPPPVEWAEGWTIGEPDVVYSMEAFRWRGKQLPEQGFEVPREGVVDYQYFTARTDFAEDRWVKGFEVRPGAADVVHHVLIMLEDPKAPPGADQLDFTSFFAVAVPGDTSVLYPEGYGKRLPAGATLVFQMHYTPNGKQRFDRSSVGLIFCEEPPALEVVTQAVVNDRFVIPAGAERHEVRGSRGFQRETALLAFFPHMHTRGADFRYVAHYPDGSSEDLLFSDYDFNWQEAYVLHDPIVLPPGARLECVGHFDNSAKNPNNPDPTVEVRWGEQSFEEMFIGYYDTVRLIE